MSTPVFQVKELRIKHVEQLLVQNGTRLLKGMDLELYLVSSHVTQNTYLIPIEYVHLGTTKKKY